MITASKKLIYLWVSAMAVIYLTYDGQAQNFASQNTGHGFRTASLAEFGHTTIPSSGPGFADSGSSFTADRAYSMSFSLPSADQSPKIDPADLRIRSVYPGPASIHYQTSGNYTDSEVRRGILGQIARKEGYVFLASALVPGLGQAANQQWWKTGVFMAVETAAIGFYIHKENTGRSGERRYSDFANEHWSVVAYARWLVDYNHQFGANLDVSLTDLANPGYEDAIHTAAYNIEHDWAAVNLSKLNELERNTVFRTTGNSFAHTLEPYNSQQYYELISKYYQYGPGWRDWGSSNHIYGHDGATSYFLKHADIGYRFNNDLRFARNMLSLMVFNHFIAAFDAFFTHRLRSHRIQTQTSMRNGPEVRLTFSF